MTRASGPSSGGARDSETDTEIGTNDVAAESETSSDGDGLGGGEAREPKRTPSRVLALIMFVGVFGLAYSQLVPSAVDRRVEVLLPTKGIQRVRVRWFRDGVLLRGVEVAVPTPDATSVVVGREVPLASGRYQVAIELEDDAGWHRETRTMDLGEAPDIRLITKTRR